MAIGITTETRVNYRGAKRVAQHCGISRMHLFYVLRGQRKPSKGLREKLEKIGVQLPEMAGMAQSGGVNAAGNTGN